MIGDDKAHLAMGQHRGLGAASGARGEEEPAGIVMLDRDVLDHVTGLRCNGISHRAFAERGLAVDASR